MRINACSLALATGLLLAMELPAMAQTAPPSGGGSAGGPGVCGDNGRPCGDPREMRPSGRSAGSTSANPVGGAGGPGVCGTAGRPCGDPRQMGPGPGAAGGAR